ncbi:hypothetical protein vseg_010466 [Gypsophila vaccaria]
MERVSNNIWKGLKRYYNKRDYVKLNNIHNDEKQTQTRTRTRVSLSREQSALQGKRRRFYWRVKISRKTRILGRVGSPKKWITRVRDAYVNMMLKISKSGLVGGVEYGLGATVVENGDVFGEGRIKEYDEKMLQQVYKNYLVVAQSTGAS